MHILVTSRSGGGKTAVCTVLQQEMGIPAFDADRVENLAGWYDLRTEQPVQVDYSEAIDKRKVGWLWKEPVLSKLLSEHPKMVLCGSSDNQLQFYDLFDKIIFLSLAPEVQIRRIQNREEHDYGKVHGMAQQIVAEQAELLAQSRKRGAIIMNADRPERNIALDIIDHLK